MTEAQTLRHIISTRKSIFPPEYSDAPIAEEVLEEIISSADYDYEIGRASCRERV